MGKHEPNVLTVNSFLVNKRAFFFRKSGGGRMTDEVGS